MATDLFGKNPIPSIKQPERDTDLTDYKDHHAEDSKKIEPQMKDSTSEIKEETKKQEDVKTPRRQSKSASKEKQNSYVKYRESKYILNTPLEIGAKKPIDDGALIYGSKKAYIEHCIYSDYVANKAIYEKKIAEMKKLDWNNL